MPYDLNYLNNAAAQATASRKAAASVRPATDGLEKFNSSMQSFAKGAEQFKKMRTPQASVKPDAGSDDGGYATDTQDG